MGTVRKNKHEPTKPHKDQTWVDEKKRFGTLPLDKLVAPTPGIFDAPTRCFVINEEWSSIVMGMVSLLAEIRMWKGAKDESFPAIREILRFLRGGNCDMFDCTDVDTCLQTADIINQIVAVTYATQEAATQAHIDELTTSYDGTPQSVGSEIPLTAPNLNSLHDNALCRTLELLVSVYANGKGISLDLLGAFGREYQSMIQDMRFLFGWAPAWLMHLLGDELGGCAADVDAAKTALASKSAQQMAACCLYDELRSGVISETNWNAALSACAASLGGFAGAIVCLMAFDSDQSHALAFFEVYSRMLERQAAGEDFVCNCAPDGWFFVDVDWDWEEPTHSGFLISPIFPHTNLVNGELFSITANVRSDNPAKQRVIPADTLLPGSLVIGVPLLVRPKLLLFEDAVVGVMEGADAIGWPAAQRVDVSMRTPERQPGAAFTIQWRSGVDLGHSASIAVSRVRLLYKEVV